ncbi:hypothetical protein HBI81_031160 [Parastagonospora nodorum]|nr:hypothetical protein HBH52_109560 [Parastagonospora nodorum]KAH4105665.1 hypothetical protein HBH46_084800 [Parastagonospora nodorum]KAH4223480.1 hypothetical protein HBI06_131030 [Parastagonospora nodorum]KAH4224295.1 hypothetical protein HBI05_240860 [Parastagonospora nodorum]KAH4909753.1 hypothetical protein HBI80_044860 [Parastagonospora nodorum]
MAVHLLHGRSGLLITFWYIVMASVATTGMFKRSHTRKSHKHGIIEKEQGKNGQTFVGVFASGGYGGWIGWVRIAGESMKGIEGGKVRRSTNRSSRVQEEDGSTESRRMDREQESRSLREGIAGIDRQCEIRT